MSTHPGPALLARPGTAGLGNTDPVTAGTQERDPAPRPPGPSPDAAGLDRLRAAVSAALRTFLDDQRDTLAGMDPRLIPVVDEVRALAEGGKRLRPAFAYWGWRAARDASPSVEDEDAVLRAVAA